MTDPLTLALAELTLANAEAILMLRHQAPGTSPIDPAATQHLMADPGVQQRQRAFVAMVEQVRRLVKEAGV